MFRIENGREHFWQWDKDQRLIVEDSSISEVHFSNKTSDCALVCEVYEEGGKRLVNVPNILLQNVWDIRVYAYRTSYTMTEKYFKVTERSKPADYIYTETEIKDYEDLKARIDEIEKGGISQEAINAAVETYLTENPIETGATAEEAAQIAQNKADIAEIKNAGYITSIPSEYVTEAELDAKGYLTEHQSLSEYAKKSELFSKDYNDLTNKPTIPSVEGLASIQYVDEKVAAIVVPSLDGYATEQWVEGKGYLTQHQSLADYSTTTQVQNMINTAIAGITDSEAVNY